MLLHLIAGIILGSILTVLYLFHELKKLGK
jgi:hypothetical protein